MKNIKKASCNNQSIKRFLSPQPSNIPCKRQCKQMDVENKCDSRKDRDICIFSGNPIKQTDEMGKRKNNLDLNTDNNAVNKFDWNSFVRDPGELQESRYPVTLNTFKSMTHSLSIVNCILEDIKIATSLDFINDELMKERVLKNFYTQFYENPQIRNIYKLETKPCPTFLKKKIMQIPTLEIIEVEDSTTNAATVATANIAPVEAISKSTELRVPAEQSLKPAPDPVSKPAELERVEAQSSKSQENEIPTQKTNAKSNILYLSKNMLLMDESFLRRHVSRNTQQIEKLDIILERIYAELLPRKQSAQTKEVKSKPTKVHEISDEVCIDISNSPVVASAVIAKGQRIEQAKQLFLTGYTKKNTLAYALRFHNGLKRRIISAILEMSIDEFKKYTKIHDVPEMYDDPKLLHDCYNYAIKAPQIWPVNLYIQLCDIFEYLQTKGVSVDNLEDISPMLLHWTELAVITNFDEIVQWDFYRCKGEKFQQFAQLDVYRKKFYEKCWMHNTWLREVPKLHVEVQKELTMAMEVVENDNNNASEVAALNEAPTRVNPVNTIEHSETATKDESANAMNVDCAEESGEATSNNTISVPNNIANVAHAQDASAGHIAETNAAILSHNPNAAGSVEQAISVKEKQNTLPEATVNVQTTTTTAKAVVEIIANSNEKVGTNNLETEAQQRIQAAEKLYFYEVEKSHTLPYLLRLHNGLKRRILHAILNITYTEFKQYTHIHEAAEIYENDVLLHHCYDFVVRKPQVWPVNLYMRLADLYKFLKIKGLTLTAADLTHVSPKLLHWHDLIENTNYDYLVFWDYYRRSGKKMSKNKTRLNTYRQKFYEKCWLYDSWIWHTPKICDNVLTDDFVAIAAAEDKENANFEIAVMTHALAERDEETTETEEENETTTEDEEITDATIKASPVQAIAGENVAVQKNATGSVSTVDAEIQTSQHLLLAACANSSTVSRETEVPAENPNAVMTLCIAIKKEKLSPLDKLQFNLTNDEENYECVPVPDDIVDLEGSISENESQEELLLPLSNSESLGTHDNNLLLSLDSTEDKVAEHTAQCTENMETESIMEQQPSLELNNVQTQLMSECIVEREIEVQTTTTTTQQPIAGPVLESNVTPLEQPQIETQTKTHSAPQTGETCSLQEQQQQEAHIVVQQALTGEQVHVPGFISREVKEELLQEVQQPADGCTKQHKQKQQTTKQPKSTGTEVATALTRIIEAHKLAKEQKQQHCSKDNAQTTVETQGKQQQEPTVAKAATMEKQQHLQQQRQQKHSQQQQHSQRLQKHSQSQQQPLQKQQLQQQSQHQQPTKTTAHQQKQKQQQQAFTVKIPLPKSQQQRKKQQQQISALKQSKKNEPAAVVQQQQQKTVSKAPKAIQQQHDASTTIAEGNNTQKRLKSTPLPQKQQASNEQRAIRQQTSIQQQQTPIQQQQTSIQQQQTPIQQQQTPIQQQQTPIQQQQEPLPTVVIPMSMLQQQKDFAVEDQAPQTQQQQLNKSLRTHKFQIIAKQKVPYTKEQLEPQQLAKPSQALHTKTHVQQELQEQEHLDNEKQMQQEQQLVPQNVAKAVVAQTQPELQQSPQQLTQTALRSLLVQQQAISNQNPNELAENPQMIESIKQNQSVQQQTTVETLNVSKPSELEFLSQQLQQQYNQPQLILQRTSTQIQEQVMLRSTGTLSQDSPINLPPFVQLANKQTTNTTKKKTVKPTKPTTRKAAKISDYVPQLTHVFQPLPVALNNKKTPTLEPTTTVVPPQSNTNVATTSHQQLTPAVEEQFLTASNISLSAPTANAMLLTLPATMNATSTSASNASFVYTLSGDSSLFNSSELLKALENYQLQRSQQQQQLTQSDQTLQQQQLMQSDQRLQQEQLVQSDQTLQQQQLMQADQTLQQQQLTQSEQSLQQQVQQEQQFEFNYNQLQVTQQQQQDYQVAIQMSPSLAFVESAIQEEEQEQQQQEQEQQQLQQQEQQEKQLQQLLQSQQLLLLQQQHQQEQQQLLLQQLLQQQLLNQQQHNQAAIQIQQPLLLLDHAEQQQQLQQQHSYQLLLQQPQQHHPPQSTVYQLVDVNQAPHTAAILAGEQVQQYLQLPAEQTQTPYFTQLAVQEESASQAQQSTTLDTVNVTAHLPLTITNELLQVNVWFEHNYAMAPLPSPTPHLTSMPSPKGVCRMRSRPLPKPFFYRRLEKIDYFRELTALNIAEYQLQCTSLGKSYLQAQIRTTHLRTVVSGDILAALLPRCAPDLLQHLQLVLQYLGEFHFNTWEQRQQRKVISKCSQRTLHTLCAHILLLFFQYSSPFQSKCLDMATGWWQFEQRNCLGVETTCASTERTDNMFEDLSLAIEPCILAEMAALKRNL